MVPGKKPKDEAAGRQYKTKASMPSYSDLTARHPPSSSSPALKRQPLEATALRSSKSWLEEPPRATPPRQITLLGRRPGADGAVPSIA